MDPTVDSSVLVQTNCGTSVFPGAHSFSIGQQYNIGQVTTQLAGPGLIDILKPVSDASYLRNRRTSPPDSYCSPGTRLRVINGIISWVDQGEYNKDYAPSLSIIDWATNRRVEQHLLWLYGFAGSGKSAIAQAVAEYFAQQKRLMASFFFFRGAGDRSGAARFATTIAAQMAGSIPDTAAFIEAAIKAHPGLLTASALEAQFQLLVLEPFLSALSSRGQSIQEPVLIVIDGFDECDDREEVASLIEHLITFYEDNPTVPLRFFIASRVEEHIRTCLEAPQVYLLNLAKHAADADIAIVVDAAFDKALKHDRVIQAYGKWPTLSEKRKLIRSAGGSFILLSMLLKFIFSPTQDGQTPMDRLPLATERNLGGLDDLYTQTLTRSKHLPHFSLIVSTLALLQEPLPILSLATLLDIKKHEVVQVLINLQSIIQVLGDDDTPVTFFHTSLRDFFMTESRSGCFYASPVHHKFLAFRCFLPAGENDIGGKRGNDIYIILYRKMHWRSHWQSFCQEMK